MQPIVTLDIGNSRIKYARFNNEGVVLQTGIIEESDISELIENSRLIVSAVRGVDFKWPSHTVFFSNELVKDIQIDIESVHSLGLDRLAAVLGAFHLSAGSSSLVIDAGTCITYDYLLENSRYKGGAISPGITMRYKALNAFTDKLPDLSEEILSGIPDDIGNRTDRAIHSGIICGITDEIKARIKRFRDIQPKFNVYITGGDALFLAKHLENEIFVEPLLVHYGLYHAFKFA